jgi:hypothetical protein
MKGEYRAMPVPGFVTKESAQKAGEAVMAQISRFNFCNESYGIVSTYEIVSTV